MNTVIFDRTDLDLIIELAGCSLDESPGSNWVEKAGGLPEYICQIARAIKRSGKSTSQAIAIAVSRVKKWATGAGVDKDTQAKAAKAVAQWESKKAKNKGKRVAASRTSDDMICLASKGFNVDKVRREFENQGRQNRRTWRANNPNGPYDAEPAYEHIREMWTDHLIAETDKYDGNGKLRKYPYTVDGDSVTFGDPVEVKTQYVAVKAEDMAGAELSDRQILDTAALLGPCGNGATDVLLQLSPRPSALEQVLAAAKQG